MLLSGMTIILLLSFMALAVIMSYVKAIGDVIIKVLVALGSNEDKITQFLKDFDGQHHQNQKQ